MKASNSKASREDVLYAFSVESDLGRDTLERYIENYPQYAPDLIDLSYELSRDVCEDDSPLLDDDVALIETSWQKHASTGKAADPLTSLSITEQRDIAKRLDVPRQVITAFREHRVELASVPLSFLNQLARMINSTVETLMNSGTIRGEQGLVRSYKADSRPDTQTSVTFEQLLIEAGVPPEKRASLMTDET